MCGRTTHQFRWKTIHALLSLRKPEQGDRQWDLFNAAPTQQVPAVRADSDGQRELIELRWGLIPSWAADRKVGSSLINARAETVADKPSFRSAFKSRRCIVPASGFYEWRREAGKSHPFYLQRRDKQPMLFAGLWESWTDKDTGELIESCTIITTEASGDVRDIHNRMPVILEPGVATQWLRSETDPESLKAMLVPAPNGTLTSHSVSSRVNSPRNRDASLIEPVSNESREDLKLW